MHSYNIHAAPYHGVNGSRMAKPARAEAQVPEVRFRPAGDVYEKAARIAERLNLTVTDVARMGLAQIANAPEIRLVQPEPLRTLRDIPIHGVKVGRIADIASAAARAVDRVHVQAGRLEPMPQAVQSVGPER